MAVALIVCEYDGMLLAAGRTVGVRATTATVTPCTSVTTPLIATLVALV